MLSLWIIKSKQSQNSLAVGRAKKSNLGLLLLAGARLSLAPDYTGFRRALGRDAEGDAAYRFSPEIFYTTASEIAQT